MVMELQLPSVRSAYICPGSLSARIGIMAAGLGLLSTTPGEVVVIAGEYGQMVIRSLLPGDPYTVALGAVQLGRSLRSAGIDWSVWSARDLDSGRVEEELRAIAGGILPSQQDGRAAP